MQVQFGFPNHQLPIWLAIGAAVIALIILGLRRLERRRQARVHAFTAAALAPRLLVAYDAKVRRPLMWLTIVGFALLAAALAQPKWGKAWVQVERGSRDILVLLDTSESMNAQNPYPNRLERARQKIESMLELCPGDRFGLVAFSGSAALQCPLTLDQGYFRTVLASVNTDTLSEEGTDIAEALFEAGRVFQEDINQSGDDDIGSRAILLISDGEQVSGDAIEAAKKMGRYAGVYVLGIGDPDGAHVTYPEWMMKHARVRNAHEPHLSKLDEDTLSKVALEGGGVYVRTTPSNNDVNYIHKELEAVSGRAVSGDLRFNLVDRYRWPLSAALACFFAEGLWIVLMPLLRHRRMKRWTGAELIRPDQTLQEAEHE